MLHPVRLGVAGGILWAVCMFIITILGMYFDYATPFLNIMASIYPGYTISWCGTFLGVFYGFIDAFVGFFLLAWLYNKFNAHA